MKVDVRAIAGHMRSLAWVALRSLVGTAIVLCLEGVVLAALSYFFVRELHWLYGVLAVALALIEAVTTGVILGAKRAVVMAVAHGLGALRLGESIVRLVFERMLGIAEGKELGGSAARISGWLERLPVAQADHLLSGAVRTVTGEMEQAGWLRRKVQTWLLEAVRKFTLARFRAEGAKHGSIDLLKIKAELEQTVDDVLVQKLRNGMRLWTTLVVLALPLLVAAQTWIILILGSSEG